MRKRSLKTFAWGMAGILTTSLLIATTANFGDDKFFVYGGPDFSIDTELRGTVVRTSGASGTDLFIAADQGYTNLGLKGNVIRGDPAVKDTGGAACYAGNDILEIVGNSNAPIIKLETYGFGARPDPGISSIPFVMDHGVSRMIQPGDHVKISGLYVIDYSHPPYCLEHVFPSPWTYLRGFYVAAYVHAELHPYSPSSLELIGANDSSEVHEVVAPIYPEVYSKTYWWNKLFGVGGTMVESEKSASRQASFFLPAPPRPNGDVKLSLVESEVIKTGDGLWDLDQSVHFNDSQADGIFVTMRATGTDVLNPAIYRARYQAMWVPQSAPDPPSPPSGLTAEEALQQQTSLLSGDHRFRLTLQADSNLVLYDQNNRALWATRTVNRNAVEAIFQSDGNFVLYDARKTALWASHTSGNPGSYLALQDDGNLVIYTQRGRPLWATNTVVH